MKALYLSTVASQWRPLAEQAVRQRQAPADYLAQLVHLEVTARLDTVGNTDTHARNVNRIVRKMGMYRRDMSVWIP